jgi:hypothetical protein
MRGGIMQGLIDFIIVGFEGNKFDGSILREIRSAVDKGIIRLVALSLMEKDEAGNVRVIDATDIGDDFLLEIVSELPANQDAITEDDVKEVTDLLENNTASGLLIVEHLWAIPLKEAITKANGVLIADGRIHPEAALELSK